MPGMSVSAIVLNSYAGPIISRIKRSRARDSRREAIEAWLYRPCYVRDARMADFPASVRGPVEGPPCILQRPLGIAAALHGVPALVLAPHRGAFPGLPGLLAFLSQPRPGSRLA
jgi:hypothetical protein